MKLIFIRHADPDYVHDSLTETGWREAKLLAPRAASWNADDVYCSPLGRAKDTCAESMKLVGIKPVEKQWLREFDAIVKDPRTGNNRIPWDLMPQYVTTHPILYDKDKWYEDPVMQTGNVYERMCEVYDGIDEVLAAHGYIRTDGLYKFKESSDEVLLFYCHLGVCSVILSHLFNVSPPCIWQNFYISPSSVTVLQSEERLAGEAHFRCTKLADISHLYAGNEPMSESGLFTKSEIRKCEEAAAKARERQK